MAIVQGVNVDFLAPRYLLTVEGTKLKADITQFVTSVVYEEGEDIAAKIELDVANPGFRFNEQKVFAEGNTVDLWIGYVGKSLHFQNRGFIVKPNYGFPRSGMPKFKVVAHGAERKLMRSDPKGRAWKKMFDADIVSKVFEEAEILPFTIANPQKKPTTRWRKKGTSNWEFLQRLARLNGFEISVRYSPTDGGFLGWFGPPEDEADQDDKFTFIYGSGEPDTTLFEFWPDFSLPSQRTCIEVSYTDPKTRKTIKLKVEQKEKSAEKTKFVGGQDTKAKKPIANGPAVSLTVFGQTEEVIMDRPFRNVSEAKRFAAAWFARREKEFIFARGTCLGTPSLKKRQVHTFNLPGNRLSGDWLLTSVRHRVSGDAVFETEFTATKKVLGSKIGKVGNASGVEKEEQDL